MKIAITTPTGHIGGGLAKHLLESGGHELTLICRDPAKLADHAKRGAKVVKADLENRDEVIRATAGAEAVFFLCPPKFDAADLRAYQNKVGDNFAAAVRTNKLKRVVFLSSFGAQHKSGTGPIAGLHDIEQKLNAASKEVGGSALHLRPASFMENWFMNVDSIKAQGAVYAPIPADASMPQIATQDIARVAAEVITDTKWSGTQVRELLGPRDYSFKDSVKIIADAIGKPVNFVQVPGDAAVQSMTGMGLSKNVASSYVEMYDGVAKGIVRSEHPRKAENSTPTTFEQFTKSALVPAIKG